MAPKMLPTYLADARGVEKFDAVSNPKGVLNLSVAENQLLSPLLVPKIRSIMGSANADGRGGLFEKEWIYYQKTHGSEECRIGLSEHMLRVISRGEYAFDPEKLIVGAGCNAVLENLLFTIAEAGEGVLIPRPYYAAFEFDLAARADLKVLPLTVRRAGFEPSSYYPTVESLEAGYWAAVNKGIKPRALLLSSPNNPLGFCYPEEVLATCLEWCESKEGLHLISDEIYAGSVYRETADGQPPWVSIASVAARQGRALGERVHVIWALSKDFALSGLRVGALYTENEAIRLPLQKLNDLCQVSSTTQQVVARLLTDAVEPEDTACLPREEQPLLAPPQPSAQTNALAHYSGEPLEAWATVMQRYNMARMRDRYERLTGILDDHGVPYLPGGAGLFLWIDLRAYLDFGGGPPPARRSRADEGALVGVDEATMHPRDAEVERALYLRLIHEYGLLLTPGASMRTEAPGFFRCVFTAADDTAFDAALERFARLGATKR